LAVIGGAPHAKSAGYAMSVPPPATALIAPARKPADDNTNPNSNQLTRTPAQIHVHGSCNTHDTPDIFQPMPARRYPALRVCSVTWPLWPRRLRVARLSAPVGLSGAGLRHSGGGRTLINGSTIVWGDPQPMCRMHQARSTCGPDHSGTTSPAGPAAAVLVYAQDAPRLDRRDWQHQLGRLRVSEDLLPLEGRPPLLGIALLTSCGTSMRCRAPARAAISFRKVVSNNSPSTIFGRGRRRSAHLSPRRGNKQNAVRSAGTRRATTRVNLLRAQADRVCRAPLVACGAPGRVWSYISGVLAFPD